MRFLRGICECGRTGRSVEGKEKSGLLLLASRMSRWNCSTAYILVGGAG